MNETQNMLAELLLQHGLLKVELATWLGVSTNVVNRLLFEGQITPQLSRKLQVIYQKLDVAQRA